jgi:crotonobetainyl-CoA:carnitine CoA-transferase CaiB-like acyl-CoA transferase
MKKLLQGLKVLDLTRLLPGPLCSLFFADLGATILKIEDPGSGGDYLRHMAPLLKNNSQGFCYLNRNKKSVSLNLRKAEGREIFFKLVKDYDVVMESFRPGVMEKIGIDYKTLKKINPKIIFCSITGFGQTGPLKDNAGHDLNFVAYSGILDPEEGRPTIPQFQIGDLSGGAQTAAIAVLAAYIHALKTNEGCHLDVSMLDGVFSMSGIRLSVEVMKTKSHKEFSDSFLSGRSPCYQIYETKDGNFMALATVEEKFWLNFLNLCQRPELNSYFMATGERAKFLFSELIGLFKSRTRDEWCELLKGDNNTCCSPILTYKEAMESEHSKSRHLVFKENHPVEGEVTHLRFPFLIDGKATEISTSAPQMGEHNDEVLKKMGLSPTEIKKLKEQNII